MVRWKTTNPEALRQIKKVSDANGRFLELDMEEMAGIVEEYRKRNFRLVSGQTIDLVKLEAEALSQNGVFVDKNKVFRKKKG